MNSNKLSTLLAQNIPDATDFPKQAASLAELDSAVRCPICSNFFDGPVSLACGHCFCSMCIRGALSSKAHCPTCRQSATESHLRPNPAIEEVVTAWNLARPYLLSRARQEERAAEPVRKKRKLSPSCVADPSRTSSAGPSHGGHDNPSSDAPDGDVPKPDAIVECPVCEQGVKYKELNRHMDNNCESTGSSKSAPSSKSQKTLWSDLMGAPPKSKGKERAAADADDRLPKVSYDTLKEKQLRDKLSEHGLLTTGDRASLTKRHQRWTMLWNANLDKSSAKRRSKAELQKDLKKWEEEAKVKKKKTTVDNSHLSKYKSEFKELVAAARPKGSIAASTDEPDSSAVLCPPSEGDVIVVDSEDEA
ncbi:hypothetical protein C8R44DRAFT_789233 [Mycena epipterygia]|nr:hypothetical protein C8R44DRAFT_789233 [Mycena epipterygia]